MSPRLVCSAGTDLRSTLMRNQRILLTRAPRAYLPPQVRAQSTEDAAIATMQTHAISVEIWQGEEVIVAAAWH